MRFLLDEHISPRVASLLRERGHDAVAVTERHGLRGLPDRALLQVALEEDRALVTRDIRDSSVWPGAWRGPWRHTRASCSLRPPRSPPALDGVGRLAGALDALAAANPGGLGSRVAWLMPLD